MLVVGRRVRSEIDRRPAAHALQVNVTIPGAFSRIHDPLPIRRQAGEQLGARLRRELNPNLAIEGLLLTMYDATTNLSSAVVKDLRDFYGSQVLKTVIPRNVRLAEAPSFGKPIMLYDSRSKGAESYINLGKEILSHG